MQHRLVSRGALLGAVAFLAAVAMHPACGAQPGADAPRGITAVPPASFAPPADEKRTAQRPLVSTAGRIIRLPAPSAAEIESAVKAARSGLAKRNARAIGFGRDIAAAQANALGSELAWVDVPGGRAARIDVQSPGAAGVRIAVTMTAGDPAVSIRFTGSAAPEDILGPYGAAEIVRATARDGRFWSPVLDGDTGSIELFAPSAVDPQSIALRIVRVSHLVATGAALKDAKLGIGSAGSCEVDVACITPTLAVQNAAKSVARLVFTDDGGVTYYCTGTLINDSVASATPYFLTANHCMNAQSLASTANTYWFYDAVSCGSHATPPYVRLTHGAMLLGRSEDYDWSILQLRDAPPGGAQFAAWRADPLDGGVAVVDAHHPEGDLKKWSQGTSNGLAQLRDVFVSDGSETIAAGSFALVQWSRGVTEGGSSGSAVMTLSTSGQYYEVRGGLWGGDSSCSNRSGLDAFSRLDKALPLMRQYLTPNSANPNGEAVAVEFYNASLDHYFMSTNPSEISDLDNGVHVGWVRTGLRFLAYGDPAQAPAGATPVCRFYSLPGIPGGGDSHFYSGDPQECADTLAKFGKDWVYESPNVFYTVLPDRDTGACPTGFSPVYRFLHTARNNHRYTTEEGVREVLALTPGWIAEGYGPPAVIMCAPPA
jgi:hypothetical protein